MYSYTSTCPGIADDTRASRGIRTSLDPAQLQKDIETIYKWAREVNMEFNGDKFESIRYWPNKDLREQFDEGSQYVNEEGETIEEKDGLKDLGVQLSNDLTFSKHNDKTVKNCKKNTWLGDEDFQNQKPAHYESSVELFDPEQAGLLQPNVESMLTVRDCKG